MTTQFKASDSERISKMMKMVEPKLKGHRGPGSYHLMSNWEKIKKKDVSVLEQQFETLFYMLYTRRIIPEPITCMIEVTKGLTASGKKKETLELYFYVDLDKIETYAPYMLKVPKDS